MQAHPASFDGTRVALTGYVVLEFEHTAVYLHESDATYGIARNGVWLDVPLGSNYRFDVVEPRPGPLVPAPH